MARASLKLRRGRPAILLGFALAVWLALYFFPAVPPPFAAPDDPDATRRAVGAIHVHSRYSDGAGDLSAISSAARRAGLEFYVVTDHNNLDGLSREGEGYEDGVLRLIGAELSTGGGHVLALDVPDPAFRFSGDPLDALADVRDLGGFAVVAHPFSTRAEFAWTDFELPGISGIEVFNFDSAWRRRDFVQPLAALLYPVFPARALAPNLAWDPGALETWDRLHDRRGRVSGWAGADAHGHVRIGGRSVLEWPRYEDVLAGARNHLILRDPLTGDVPHDRALVLEALREGRGYVSLDGLADGSRFTFSAESASEHVPMGAWVDSREKLRFTARVEAPPGTRLRLLRDGVSFRDEESLLIDVEAPGPGIYRAEAWLAPRFVPARRHQPWIVSNPIYVLPREEMERRTRASETFPAPVTSAGLDCEELGTEKLPIALHAEHDAASTMDEEAARSGGASFRLSFELSRPEADRPYVWCAVADRTRRDLSGFVALRFRVKADGVYRVAVQVRDGNPRGPAEGTEWWEKSFKTGADGQEIVLPFDHFRSKLAASDGKLDLGDVRGTFFILDSGNTRPRVKGVIDVEGLAFCRPVP